MNQTCIEIEVKISGYMIILLGSSFVIFMLS